MIVLVIKTTHSDKTVLQNNCYQVKQYENLQWFPLQFWRWLVIQYDARKCIECLWFPYKSNSPQVIRKQIVKNTAHVLCIF